MTTAIRRQSTTIMVQPINVSRLEAEALAFVKEHGLFENPTACKAGSAPHGYVETSQGVYAFSSEGVGPRVPITKSMPHTIDFYSERKEGGRSTCGILPACSISLDPDQLRELADGEKVNLADFIRSFGARLERNYEAWVGSLTQEG